MDDQSEASAADGGNTFWSSLAAQLKVLNVEIILGAFSPAAWDEAAARNVILLIQQRRVWLSDSGGWNNILRSFIVKWTRSLIVASGGFKVKLLSTWLYLDITSIDGPQRVQVFT